METLAKPSFPLASSFFGTSIPNTGSGSRQLSLNNALGKRVGGGRRSGRGGSMLVSARVREIFMPALSSTMTEGKIVSWVKSEGEKLSKGESVVVVESDKADMDVETFYDGYLAAILVGEGEVATVGAPIGFLAETEDEIEEARSKASSSSSSSSSVSQSESSVPPPPPPPPSPTPAPLPTPTISEKAAVAPVVEVDATPRRVFATPYARKLSKQYKIDLASIKGSGPNGRITASDVEMFAGKAPSSPTPTPALSPVSMPVPTIKPPPALPQSTIVAGTTVPFTAMQAAVARNMVESLNVPTFRVGYTISTDALDALYKKIKSKGVTMTALLAKAAAVALAQHPVVNASCKDGKSFTYNSSVNIAVAVAMDGGLLTPVLQDADKMDIYTLSKKWKELVDKARAKQLQPHEYNTGTFTLSNLGMFGVDRFDAILPPGTGAIMAIGSSQRKVVANPDGFLGVKSQMQVNVTADHRIIYGAELAAFLQTFASVVEKPDELTL